jgi:hypothetical protein
VKLVRHHGGGGCADAFGLGTRPAAFVINIIITFIIVIIIIVTSGSRLCDGIPWFLLTRYAAG